MDHLSIGKLGEDIACKYLKSKKYRIIERNHRKPWGEIDIIAKAYDATLVFIEVKTIKQSGGWLTPEDNMTAAKVKKTKRACQMFADQNTDLVDENKGWRIDLMAIAVNDPKDGERLTELLKSCTVRHYENV